MPAATPAPRRLPGPRPEDAQPAYDPGQADDPWLHEDPGPPPQLDDDPNDPEDIIAWLDAELAKAAPWLANDPWLTGDPDWDNPGGHATRSQEPGRRGAGGRDPRRSGPTEVFKAGRWDRSRGDGGGFAAGGLADHLPPGPVLAGLAGDRWQAGLDRLSDDELIGVLRAARRLASWAAAMELAAVTDLWRRRTVEEDAGDTGAALHADAEIAAALTLTRRAADHLLGQAIALRRLPATRAALASGAIDLPRAQVITDELTGLTGRHTAAVEAAIIGAAPGQTTGQLRAAARRAVLAADPAAARRRKEQALRQARVERWSEPAGTATLAGRDLPPAAVLAADANLTALAKQLKAAGAEGSMDTLRAQIYLALLSGTPPSALLPAIPGTDLPGDTSPAGPVSGRPGRGNTGNGTPDGSDRPGGSSQRGDKEHPSDNNQPAADDQPGHSGRPSDNNQPAADDQPGHSGRPSDDDQPGPSGWSALGNTVAGRVNLTVPLATWLGRSSAPGDVPGFGPLDAADARTLADALAAQAGTKWCLTFTGPDGRPLAHGCAPTGPPPGRRRTQPGTRARAGPQPASRDRPRPGASQRQRTKAGQGQWTGADQGHWTVTVTALTGGCDHALATPVYQPPAGLRHLVNIRHATCVFPGCRRPAAQCDADHTIPYQHGGKTCLCNLAPLCRHHHQVKQTPGWTMQQTSPGTLTWTTPSGRRYTSHSE